MALEFFRISKNPLMPFHVKRLKNGNRFSRRRHIKDETAPPCSDNPRPLTRLLKKSPKVGPACRAGPQNPHVFHWRRSLPAEGTHFFSSHLTGAGTHFAKCTVARRASEGHYRNDRQQSRLVFSLACASGYRRKCVPAPTPDPTSKLPFRNSPPPV